jgi:hypothetical protein
MDGNGIVQQPIYVWAVATLAYVYASEHNYLSFRDGGRMGESSMHEHGRVLVRLDEQVQVKEITFDGKPLVAAIASSLWSKRLPWNSTGIVLPAETESIILELLNALSALPEGEKEKRLRLADYIFNVFYSLVVGTAKDRNPLRDLFVMRAIIDIVWKWEESHENVHKGSAYYWAALSLLRSGDILGAYPYIFSAAEEDEANILPEMGDYRGSPANMTISLLPNPNNALYSLVVSPLRDFLQSYVTRYNSSTGNTLDLSGLDTKFLQVQSTPLKDIRKFFVATLHELYHSQAVDAPQLTDNDYVKLKRMDLLFNLALITDQILEHRYRQRPMARAVFELAVDRGWTSIDTTLPKDKWVGEFLGRIVPRLNDHPNLVIAQILDGTATFNRNPLDGSQRGIFLAYHIRNHAAHNIESIDILVNRYHEVLENLVFAFLLSVEVL